ncbi:hypothetical protein J6590_010746 [Homalodisca vitripennis]|nr:hypothetical protein J6590_010746 [Homalodisca vitripennis]
MVVRKTQRCFSDLTLLSSSLGASKPSLTLNLGTKGLKVTSEPPPIVWQTGCLQGHAQRLLIQAAGMLDSKFEIYTQPQRRLFCDTWCGVSLPCIRGAVLITSYHFQVDWCTVIITRNHHHYCGSSSSSLQKVLVLQKKALRTMEAFKNLQILTIPSIYTLETILHCILQNLNRNEQFHKYHTRNELDFTLPLHRTELFAKKPSYAGAKQLHSPIHNVDRRSKVTEETTEKVAAC